MSLHFIAKQHLLPKQHSREDVRYLLQLALQGEKRVKELEDLLQGEGTTNGNDGGGDGCKDLEAACYKWSHTLHQSAPERTL